MTGPTSAGDGYPTARAHRHTRCSQPLPTAGQAPWRPHHDQPATPARSPVPTGARTGRPASSAPRRAPSEQPYPATHCCPAGQRLDTAGAYPHCDSPRLISDPVGP